MGTPTSERILKRAEELWLRDLTMKGYVTSEVPTTPELEELKEGGFWKMAQQDLMRSEATKLKREQEEGIGQERTWMFGRGEELGLKVMEKEYYQSMQRNMRQSKWALRAFKSMNRPKRVSLRKPLDIASAIRGKPRPTSPMLSLRFLRTTPRVSKKRQRNHSQRTGKTMRVLRHLKHKKSFSFPDSVWGVRK